jgi:dipeptidyl-peptidase 4
MSPDGKRAVFIRDNNLWAREVEGGAETQLTKDGIQDFGYATDNAGWQSSDRPIVVWSPDSAKIATFQQDQRGVGEMYLVNTAVGHPTLKAWKYPLPGDAVVTTIQPVIIDVAANKMVRLQIPPQQHRSTLCDDVRCGGEWSDAQWSDDGKNLAFVSTARDHREETLRLADAATGAVRDVYDEKVAKFFESGNGAVNWKYLPKSNEFIWFSEQSGWGHLYLYDVSTGKLKNQITKGDWNVTRITRIDEKNRVLYVLGVGHEKGRDPYFIHFYRVGFDGNGLTLLTPDDGNHDVALSPSGHYFVDTYSKPDVPPVSDVRDDTGKLVAHLEKADISKLLATGWKPPQPIVMKARDGVTDIYGLMFKPYNLDPNKKYPIVNHIYPGPQTGSVGSRNFSTKAEAGHGIVGKRKQIHGIRAEVRSRRNGDPFPLHDAGSNVSNFHKLSDVRMLR